MPVSSPPRTFHEKTGLSSLPPKRDEHGRESLAARDLGITIISAGKCTFPVRMIQNYHPTRIVGSVFKLLYHAHQMKQGGFLPQDSRVERQIIGGESFAEGSRSYLAELWGCEY